MCGLGRTHNLWYVVTLPKTKMWWQSIMYTCRMARKENLVWGPSWTYYHIIIELTHNCVTHFVIILKKKIISVIGKNKQIFKLYQSQQIHIFYEMKTYFHSYMRTYTRFILMIMWFIDSLNTSFFNSRSSLEPVWSGSLNEVASVWLD